MRHRSLLLDPRAILAVMAAMSVAGFIVGLLG
jgi:hypothetical protein